MGTFPFRREEYAPYACLSIIKLRKVMICSAVRHYFPLKRKMHVPILGPRPVVSAGAGAACSSK